MDFGLARKMYCHWLINLNSLLKCIRNDIHILVKFSAFLPHTPPALRGKEICVSGIELAFKVKCFSDYWLMCYGESTVHIILDWAQTVASMPTSTFMM